MKNNFLHAILNRLPFFKRRKGNGAVQGTTDPMLEDFMQMLDATEEGELACDEVFALLDEYAELILKGEDAARAYPLIKKHLDMCKDCREEYEALMRILGAHAP